MKKTIFIKNALILTAASLILRFAGIILKVWLAKIVGSEGIGLYQLIFSVYMLAATFATSGISTAVTRLCAEEMSLGSKKGTIRIVHQALKLTLIIAFASVLILFFGADFIAGRLLGDIRCASAIKILPLALPFMGVTSCLRGYFIARRSVTPNALSQIFEQAVRIFLVIFLVKKYIGNGLEECCSAIVTGEILAEIFASIMLYIIYKASLKKLNRLHGRDYPPYRVTKKIIDISLPITSGRYLNTALRTGENILVPKNLAKYALNGSVALSQFGMIKGMALPLLFFPSTLLNSVSTLLIPEISEASAKNQKGLLKSTTASIIKLTSIIAFVFSAIFLVAGDEIGVLIYKNEDVGFLLKWLSPIVPFMYLDSISDGILKGLDQQVFSFRTAISDSVIRIILILLIVPFYGLMGFIGIMYFSNLFTCMLNVNRLIKITKASLETIREILLPLLSAFSVTLLSSFLLKSFFNLSGLVYIILLCLISLSLYLFLLLSLKSVEKEEILHYIK